MVSVGRFVTDSASGTTPGDEPLALNKMCCHPFVLPRTRLAPKDKPGNCSTATISRVGRGIFMRSTILAVPPERSVGLLPAAFLFFRILQKWTRAQTNMVAPNLARHLLLLLPRHVAMHSEHSTDPKDCTFFTFAVNKVMEPLGPLGRVSFSALLTATLRSS